LRGHQAEIERLGGRIVAVGTGDPSYAKAFVADESISFPVLVDDRGEAARAAAVPSSSFLGMFHPRTWKKTRETWARGYRIHKAGARVTQLGATFVIAPGPRVTYAHLDADSTDHAPVEEILAALRAAATDRTASPA
jgi:peroxiredoxin